MLKFAAPHINHLMKHPLDFVHLIDEIPIGILILDKDRRVVHLNRAFEALSGFSASRAHGVQCRNILRSAACITHCPVLSIKGDNRAITCDSDMINLDRQLLPIRMTVAPVLDAEGRITGFVETIEDIRLVQNLDGEKSAAYSFANIIGRSPEMEKIVGVKIEHILPVGLNITEIHIGKPLIIDINVGTLQFVLITELLIKGIPKHAAATGHVDFSFALSRCLSSEPITFLKI